jgi:hypothetical protein
MTTDTFDGLDFSRLVTPQEDVGYLDAIEQRADALVNPFVTITPTMRMGWFQQIGYRPQGLFWPEVERYREQLQEAFERVRHLPHEDNRLYAYTRLQEQCQRWFEEGIPGSWDSQQAIARSPSQFRLAAYGRRGGKTFHAAHEAYCVGRFRAKSLVWLCGPVMEAASRCFDVIKEICHQQGDNLVVDRDTEQHKEIELENGSIFVCITLKTVGEGRFKSGTAVGAAVDFAVVDEAAQIPEMAWTRAILPPLMDRKGQALLLSSFEGEDEFFYAKGLQARRDAQLTGGTPDWEVFQAPSWDTNFRVFPQGRKSEMIAKAERESAANPLEFLEQYGAIPTAAKARVYPQFRRAVHVGKFPLNENHPVTLAIDPSFGSNQYGVVAIQDYDAYAVIVDEYYQTHVTAEDVSQDLRSRPWAPQVRDVIVDSAAPMEIYRWQVNGWPAYPVHEKPEIAHRLPLHRNWLREPTRFYQLYRQLANEVLVAEGHELDADFDMPPEQQVVIILQVEEMLSDDKLTDELIRRLRQCARLFIDEHCVATIFEHESYRYPPMKRDHTNIKENPIDRHNHLMDCIGYFLWHLHRHELPDGYTADDNVYASAIRGVPINDALRPLVRPLEEGETLELVDDTLTAEARSRVYLAGLRALHQPGGFQRTRSMIGRG